MTINVFIVDDSATARTAMRLILEDSDDINVIGVASTPVIALKRMQKIWPDVIISDLEMPDMSGQEFLEYLQKNRPTPFIVFSNYTGANAMSSVEALSKGALDIIAKPNFSCEESLQKVRDQILNSIRAAAKIKRPSLSRRVAKPSLDKSSSWEKKLEDKILIRKQKLRNDKNMESAVRPDDGPSLLPRDVFSVLALGSSTGGTTIIEHILKQLTTNSPPVVVVQHMPEHFTLAFAKRINQFCEIDVREAENGDVLKPGLALIAPGGKHMELVRKSGKMQVRVFDAEPVNSHKPSVDVLFNSVADSERKDALGVILTGMGKDGAKGLLAMRDVGALTLSQAGDDCAVNGMPKAALAINAVDLELKSDDIAAALSNTSQRS
ncbi:MAG: chemotaxis-specific protein-glutamate methyltransferase CheB [Pseudomonadales bacterium]|nr:chemotaxis-specific protein-glutamate methyltransferase CheB [Pseudomonadales bacterium]